MGRIKVLMVFGTRPEAIKMAPLLLELRRRPEIEVLSCVTAQHRDMLDSVLDTFKIKTEYDLNIMEHGQTLERITVKALEGVTRVIREVNPDLCLVHGDTTTTMAASLAAFYAGVKLGHVEAGLRSFNKHSPYPEELNRKMTSVIADLHFCPTSRNALNLANEGISKGVYVTGNTAIDVFQYTVRDDYISEYEEIRQLDYENKRIIPVTIHRRENYGKPMENIFEAFRQIAARGDVEIVYPLHMSPVVRETAHNMLGNEASIHLVPNLELVELHSLLKRSSFVITDSGGIQEEAPSLGKPVLVARRETERQEAIEAGTVKLTGTETGDIYRAAEQLLDDTAEYQRMSQQRNPYGDGKASERICDAILYSFGERKEAPERFEPENISNS